MLEGVYETENEIQEERKESKIQFLQTMIRAVKLKTERVIQYMFTMCIDDVHTIIFQISGHKGTLIPKKDQTDYEKVTEKIRI